LKREDNVRILREAAIYDDVTEEFMILPIYDFSDLAFYDFSD
jgi:hypothetical protein